MTTLFIDTETTGLHRNDGDDLVEVAVVDDDGALKLSTLVDQSRQPQSRYTALPTKWSPGRRRPTR